MRRYCLIFAVCRLLSGVFCPSSVLWLSMYALTPIHTHTHTHKYIRFILRYFSKFSCGFFAVVYRSRSLFMRYTYIHMYKYMYIHVCTGRYWNVISLLAAAAFSIIISINFLQFSNIFSKTILLALQKRVQFLRHPRPPQYNKRLSDQASARAT